MKRSRYFNEDEARCQHCGELKWDDGFVIWLDEVRHRCGFPFIITSWYRCKNHPIELAKPNGPGSHETGKGVDIAVAGPQAIKVIEWASALGCVRIGVNAGVFVHLDRCEDWLPPALWTY